MALKCIQSKYADCGITKKVEAKCSYQNLSTCSDKRICKYATDINGRWWSTLDKAVAAAKQRGLGCGGVTDQPTDTVKTVQKGSTTLDGQAIKNVFKSQTTLRRKQLQYALKKLGLYSSSVDGLWGNGTRTAFSNYIKINDLEVSSGEDVFASVLSKVDVPSAFAAPKRATGNQRQSVNSNNTAGLRAIISRPSVTGAQALAICEPQAEMAGENASDHTAPLVMALQRTALATVAA